MTTTTISLNGQAFSYEPASYSDASGAAGSGYVGGYELRTALRFAIPSDLVGGTLASASLAMFDLYRAGPYSEPSTVRVGLYVRSGSTQSVPANLSAMLSVAVGTAVVEFANASADVLVPTSPYDATVNVASLIQEAMDGGWLGSGYICVIWKPISGSDNEEQFYADGLGAGADEPTLYLDYTPAASGPNGSVVVTLDDVTAIATGYSTIQGSAAITLGDVAVAATGTQPQQAGSVFVTLNDVTVVATGDPLGQGDVDVTLDEITVAAFGSSQASATLGVTLDDITIASAGFSGAAFDGAVTVTLDDVSLVATGTTATLGAVAITLDDVTAAAVSMVRPKRRNRGLFPSNLFLDSQFANSGM